MRFPARLVRAWQAVVVFAPASLSVIAFSANAAPMFMGLGDLPGSTFYSEANGISADGSTVVGVGRGGSEAFIWDATNGMQGLGDFPGGIFQSEAHAVSADGSTVVGTGRSASGSEAFIWDATNGLQGIGTLPGGRSDSEAKAISADGSTVVGLASISGSSGEAFIWDATNGIRGLGDLPGGAFQGAAFGVSADGSIVVGQGFSASGSEAFIWDATNGMQSLEVLLTSLGIDLTGWQLRYASDISADGKTIVGHAINPSGFHEAFITTIPEPNTALLLALGLTGLAARRRSLRS